VVDGLLGSLMDLRELTDCDEVVGRRIEDALKLGTRLVETAKLEKRPAEGDPRREIRRMLRKPRFADLHGLFAVSSPPVLFGKLRKSNRRRIPLDPASKVFNPRVVGHPYIMG